MGEKYGGRRHEINLNSNGRYLQKVNMDKNIRQHPMMAYANYEMAYANYEMAYANYDNDRPKTLSADLPTKI